MMHILLMILKIIGIILLAAVGLLLLALLLVLFCPVAYRGRFVKKADSMTGSVSVAWLFRLVRVTAFYDNGEHGFQVRIFGIPLDAVGRLLSRRKGRKAEDPGGEAPDPGEESPGEENPEKEKSSARKEETPLPDKKEHNGQEEEKILPKEEKRQSTQAEAAQMSGDTEDAKSAGPEEKKEFFPVRIWRGIVSFFRLLAGLPQRILQAVRGFFQKISDLLKKTGRFRELLSSEEFISALGLVRGSTGKLLRHVRPRKIRGYLKFGFEDPGYTGLCLGAVSMVYPWYHKTLTVEPDFQHKVLEADLYLRGRVFGVYALYIFIKVYFDKNIKYMIRKFRDKEARS